MAWAWIQSTSSATTGTSLTATYGTNLSSGTKLIAIAVTSTSLTAQISGVASGATTFTKLASARLLGDSSTTAGAGIWAVDTPAGLVGTKPTITATVSGSGTPDGAILIAEVSGLATGATLAAMVDGTPGVITRGSTTSSSSGSPTYSSNVANEFLVAVYADDGDGVTWTKPAALTASTAGPGSSGAATGINTSGANDLVLAYGNSTGSTEAGSWGMSGGGTGVFDAFLLAFKLPAAPTSGPALHPFMQAVRARKPQADSERVGGFDIFTVSPS
jgi:hypothetical protein